MQKKFLTIGFVAILSVTIVLLVGVRLFITGAVGFDDWVMRQVLGVAQTYLVPTIEFDDFDYNAPLTVTYHGVRLVSPDGIEVVNAGELIVTLGEVPKRGKPIVIEGVTVRDGVVRLIASPDDPETTFKGLAPFVKKSNLKAQEQLAKEVRLSETLDLRTLSLVNAGILFDPGDGQPPMRLDALTMAMDIEPVSDGASADGVWHQLDINIDRGDLFTLVVDGRMNLDILAAELDALNLRVDVGTDSVAALPPQLQQILTDHDAQGQLEINLKGAAEISRWRQSELAGAINLHGFNLGLGEYRMPIDSGVAPISVSNGAATVGPVRIEALEGIVHALVGIDLTNNLLPADLEWSFDGFNLRELLRTAAPQGEQPKFAGLLGSFGSASVNLTDIPGSIEGRGEAHIIQGRLVNIPGVRELNEALDVGAAKGGGETLSDKFDIVFGLTDQAIRVDSSVLETNALLARGKGRVYYNQNLDLTLNAGPVEKVQSLLGKFGKVLGNITDQFIEYHVTGTVSEPQVAVRPFGIGF